MWKKGHWAWVPQYPDPNDASKPSKSNSAANRINNPHLNGKPDRYRPSYHDNLRRGGIIPPPARESGSKVFRSKRRIGPNAGRVSKFSRHQPTQRTPTRSSGRLLEEQLALVKPSSPPRNAPKAPLADRLRELDEIFGIMEVAPKAPLADRLQAMEVSPALPAPFRQHISEDVCTHYLCPVSDPHPEGLFLHQGRLPSQPHGYFGAANPPPWIKEAYEKVQRGNGEASEMDYINLQYFGLCHPPHFELCREDLWV